MRRSRLRTITLQNRTEPLEIISLYSDDKKEPDYYSYPTLDSNSSLRDSGARQDPSLTLRASRAPGASGRSLCVRTHIFFPDEVSIWRCNLVSRSCPDYSVLLDR